MVAVRNAVVFPAASVLDDAASLGGGLVATKLSCDRHYATFCAHACAHSAPPCCGDS